VNWRTYLKFPDEARLSPEAKDIICRLLCDVEHRMRGADEIKVFHVAFRQYPPELAVIHEESSLLELVG
jgi:serine/threonine kinase 38